MQLEAPEFPGSAPLTNIVFTWRNNATGGFWTRYPFVIPCKGLNRMVEAWTKADGNVPISLEALEATGALTKDEIAQSVELAKNAGGIIAREFMAKGLRLIDVKLELGKLKDGDGKIVLIDAISLDGLRACRGFKPDKTGNCKLFKECAVTNYSGGKRTIENKNQVSAAELINVFS
jgi:phosphoribosylaminoimidazole-succinocarboxamide synthase